jgi:ribosomal protein S18 acetylase RimI-like enzyme
MEPAVIRAIEAGEETACEAVLRALPDWFGIEAALVQYVRDLADSETLVAVAGGQVVGFLALRHHNKYSSEIYVMGVSPEYHGAGIGRALIETAEALLQARWIEYLQVKTLGPSRFNRSYERTRRFYERLGFRPLEENNLWGEMNPCLVMVKWLGGRRP